MGRENLPYLGPRAHSPAVFANLRVLSFAAPLWFLACASSPYPSVNDPMPPPEPGTVPGPGASKPVGGQATKSAPLAALKRAEVERVVDAGLGRFLSQVTIEPSLSAGKFVGWSIVGLQPADLWAGVDLRPGDVVTRVNGMAIEREGQAFDAFQAARQASTLEVSYLRQNQPRLLRLSIVGAPSPALPQAAPTAGNGRPAAPAPAPTPRP